MIYVLDTSAILSGKFFGGNVVTSPLVLKEIKPKGHSWRLLKYMESAGMKIIQPPKEAVEEVIKIARKTGDIAKLSDVDIEVLALAHHLKGILLTDDYSMQNVADELGICYRSIIEKGIKRRIYWIFKCASCGKYFDKYMDKCPICGGEIRRQRYKKEK